MKWIISKKLLVFPLLIICVYMVSCDSLPRKEDVSLREIALKESTISIHPGKPGKSPFWNGYAKRFIYAPSFNYDKIENANHYLYEVVSDVNSKEYIFESSTPNASLSPIWTSIPVGFFNIKVKGITSNGGIIDLAGSGRYYRAAPFAGIYHEPVLPYNKSAELALEKLMKKDYVQYWITHQKPDPSYLYYRYPTKMFGALIVGAVTYAKLKPNTVEAKRAKELAVIVADFLMDISNSEGSPLEYFPPTYRGYEGYDAQFNESSETHMNYDNTMIPYAADAGNAYLDLYDYSGNEKYFEAAVKIANTYKKTQLENGSWHLYVNKKTGTPTAPNIAIPTSMINYFNRLTQNYGVKDLDDATQAALNWIMVNPVKTYNWQGQFEDVKASQPYQNQSREQACDLAVYLFKNHTDITLAEELLRFAEDQFVIWEQPIDIEIELIEQNSSKLGYNSKNWITPCVMEQYEWWMPVSRSAGIMINTYWEAYNATGKEIYLAKAKSIANSFTVVQEKHQGEYPTYFTEYNMGYWLNNTIYPAKVMMNFNDHLENLKNKNHNK
jgi:maltose/maltodextrin transport system substrate-binding protein